MTGRFVRHAYFLGGNDPFERLKTALRAEIDENAWATLYRTEGQSFPKPQSLADHGEGNQSP
jgi:adenine-specific DNA-methyltransferase